MTIVSDQRVSDVKVKLLFILRRKLRCLAFIIIGEREAVISFVLRILRFRIPHWGIRFRGARYTSLFARWFDEIWQSPDAFTVYSRDEANHEHFR